MSVMRPAFVAACAAAAVPVPVTSAAAAPIAQCSGTAPIRRHFAVAPGNYDVVVGLGSSTKAANTSMSVEARRQILNAVATSSGQVVGTHFSSYGATQMSNLVVQGVRELNLLLVPFLR